ncbi:hypothetical protein ACLOJK_008679 [Asimina triloba]
MCKRQDNMVEFGNVEFENETKREGEIRLGEVEKSDLAYGDDKLLPTNSFNQLRSSVIQLMFEYRNVHLTSFDQNSNVDQLLSTSRIQR